jgi:pyruvate formate lyase activating enzyme
MSTEVTPSRLGRFFVRTEDARYRCELCPRFCTLRPGQRGFCYVRQAHDDGIHLETWGRSSGFCVDPVEKKPLNHFLPGSRILSFGTAGCNLGCKFCQNWSISKAKADDRLQSHAEPAQIAELAVRQGCESVAFTYNDPVIFAEYAIDTAVACRERGVRTVAVTAGYITRPAAVEFYGHMDAANIDLKAFSERFYEKLCFAHLQPVLETIAYVAHETDCWLELTTLLIPGENDSAEELEQLCRWCADTLGPDVPLHFTAFHPDFKLTDRPSTPPETLLRAREIAHAHGLHYVYTGNIRDRAGGTTRCPACAQELVVRDGYRVLAQRVADGRCSCGEPIAGRWS